MMEDLIGITMGCPVGIGPEIIVRVFSEREPALPPVAVVLGDAGRMQEVAAALQAQVRVVSWKPGEALLPGTIPVYNLSTLPAGELTWGRPDSRTGKAMAGYIEHGVRLVLDETLSALVTCPISKIGLKMAGYAFPGHTEMLAHLTGVDTQLMMMAGSRLKVVLATIHEPLCRVPSLLSVTSLADCLRFTAEALHRDFGLAQPRIAVASLNPHGGEQGMFGTEESEIIAPAIAECGVDTVSGPWPPDTVFHRALQGEFDVVVAMYHDQGLIPFKLVHFSDGVNVTLGLPIVRTSVDHGTAYDIAGQGKADCSSLRAAWGMAESISRMRRKKRES